jgi:hypothetical protein
LETVDEVLVSVVLDSVGLYENREEIKELKEYLAKFRYEF